jgi:hypothetical protein
MRHRIGGQGTGLGNSAPEQLDGKSTGDKKMDRLINKAAKEAYELFFKSFGYCDAQFSENEVRLGVEPAYMYENLKIISIRRNKEYSKFTTGHAWGAYGSGIVSTDRYYSDYKYKCKFTKFVDKWHDVIFKTKTK